MMCYAEQFQWEQDLEIAGWDREEGWWVHPQVGGLHNLASAIAILQKWIDQ
jgi:hypothetical protein